MSLTLDEVKYIAKLARIELTPDELENYRTQISAILDHFDQLQELDIGETPFVTDDLKIHINLRKDKAKIGLALNDLMRNAAAFDEDQFHVPPVFD